ncbi:UPF0175 family protein [Lewinella sp. 4G2]|uniref:UPF0175 family protein n=1 Tax=Lewinella sp. 4G2 TaxID=1803372 RepID=UPI0007B4E3FF|nr:UPF0175 family protein [Lewinella sp. 4G2]OAV42612.1 hypothetical protein A3850_015305 [Lewinella sp. 4G2]
MSINIHVPDNVHLSEKEIKMSLAAKLYGDQRISLAQGAEIVGITKEEFMRGLGDQGVSFVQYEVQEELDNLSEF